MESKDKQINIRVSEDEKALIAERAKEQGQKISEYIRLKILQNDDVAKNYQNTIQTYSKNYGDLLSAHSQLLQSQKLKDEQITELLKMFNKEQQKTLALKQELDAEKNKKFFEKLKTLFTT